MSQVYSYLNGPDNLSNANFETADIFSSTIQNYSRFVKSLISPDNLELMPNKQYKAYLKSNTPAYFLVRIAGQSAPLTMSKYGNSIS